MRGPEPLIRFAFPSPHRPLNILHPDARSCNADPESTKSMSATVSAAIEEPSTTWPTKPHNPASTAEHRETATNECSPAIWGVGGCLIPMDVDTQYSAGLNYQAGRVTQSHWRDVLDSLKFGGTNQVVRVVRVKVGIFNAGARQMPPVDLVGLGLFSSCPRAHLCQFGLDEDLESNDVREALLEERFALLDERDALLNERDILLDETIPFEEREVLLEEAQELLEDVSYFVARAREVIRCNMDHLPNAADIDDNHAAGLVQPGAQLQRKFVTKARVQLSSRHIMTVVVIIVVAVILCATVLINDDAGILGRLFAVFNPGCISIWMVTHQP
ncbi:hypothetical protein BV22DRAFT_1051385 [Leucogyrophana mollusca]|uniref:Uncharacterized protein n=1 Tax=Leucogyrophana mollusca TaxID=85980 RepID=A0ACB8B1J3_9AGAM|nr:hypothetical protein BV22DRAFT_1051385 [Leucogyrophana mollusca]